jgi:putative nucleotidyltransferase with HDIG domain
MDEYPGTPRPFLFLTALVLACALATALCSWWYFPPQLSVQLVLLILAVLLSENFAFAIEPYSLSIAFPLGIATAVLCGPAAGCVVAALSSTNYREIRDHKPLAIVAFNFGQLPLVTGLSAWVYVLLGGRVLQSPGGAFVPWSSADFPGVLIPLTAMAAVCVLGNMLATATGGAVYNRQPLVKMASVMFGFAPTQLALAFVGTWVAQVLAISALALPLFAAPLVVARQMYLRYAGLKVAYADTIRSLIGALETKDPYTRGHSERVAVYAAALGTAMGLDARALERLEYAALLHDLGKLAVPGAVLTKPDKLEPAEMDRIREHPARGAEMVKRIPHLRDLADTVARHHERIDGTGYPAGIDGAAMPLAARILAVADSFDAMTTTRAYRPALNYSQALDELRSGAGRQFDAEIVRVFIESGVGTTYGDLGPSGVSGPSSNRMLLGEGQ